MNIIIMGSQGSGKGTQAALLAQYLRIPHVSTGNLLREIAKKDTPLGKKIKQTIDAGHLVDDNMMKTLLQTRLEEPDAKDGCVLDGFPRNKKQAQMVDTIMDVDQVIVIEIQEKTALERITKRAQCASCQTIYDKSSMPHDGRCTHCNKKIQRRDDDTPDAVRKRLAIFYKETKPVIDAYEKRGIVTHINGEQDITHVFEEIKKKIKK